MIYWQLFLSFFQIGLLSFGGGYAAMPLIQNQVVDTHGWLTLAEFVDVVTIAEMTPGPIGINAATFVGTQIAGLSGAIVATVGCVTPSCIIVLTLAYLYFKYKNLKFIQGALNGLRPAIVALIASAGLSIMSLAFFGHGGIPTSPQDINSISIFIFFIAILILRKYKLSPIQIILGSGLCGVILYSMF